MKIGAAIAIMVLLAATLLSGCPKSESTLLENSKKPGNVLPSEGDTSAPSDVEQGTAESGK